MNFHLLIALNAVTIFSHALLVSKFRFDCEIRRETCRKWMALIRGSIKYTSTHTHRYMHIYICMFRQYRFGIYLALEWAHQIPPFLPLLSPALSSVAVQKAKNKRSMLSFRLPFPSQIQHSHFHSLALRQASHSSFIESERFVRLHAKGVVEPGGWSGDWWGEAAERNKKQDYLSEVFRFFRFRDLLLLLNFSFAFWFITFRGAMQTLTHTRAAEKSLQAMLLHNTIMVAPQQTHTLTKAPLHYTSTQTRQTLHRYSQLHRKKGQLDVTHFTLFSNDFYYLHLFFWLESSLLNSSSTLQKLNLMY